MVVTVHTDNAAGMFMTHLVGDDTPVPFQINPALVLESYKHKFQFTLELKASDLR